MPFWDIIMSATWVTGFYLIALIIIVAWLRAHLFCSLFYRLLNSGCMGCFAHIIIFSHMCPRSPDVPSLIPNIII
ncbi:MAG: hypothetical protein ACFFAO_11495 [Candidatus Hermodarchaeota archaeon]